MKANVDYPYARASIHYFDLMGQMTSSQIKVVGAVIRMTVGWDKEFAEISYSDFMRYTQIKSRTSVSDAIKSSIKKGYIAIDDTVGSQGKKRYTIGPVIRYGEAENPETNSTSNLTNNGILTEQTSTINIPIEAQIGTMSVPPNDCTSTINVPVDNHTSTDNGTSTGTINCTTPSTMNVPIEAQTSMMSVPLLKKEVLKEKKEKEKEIKKDMRYARSQLVFYFVQALSQLELEIPDSEIRQDPISENAPEADNQVVQDQPLTKSKIGESETLITDFSDTPFSAEEYEYFMVQRKYSLKHLSDSVYCPIEWDFGGGDVGVPYWIDRQYYDLMELKDLSDWQKAVGLIEAHFQVSNTFEAASLAKQLLGTAEKGERKTHRISPGMDVVELCAFCHWLEFMKEQNIAYRPRKAEKVFGLVQEFRALPNLFEHLNFARYHIRTFFQKPIVEFDPDSEPIDKSELMSPEEFMRIQAEWEAHFGFKVFDEKTYPQLYEDN